MLLYISFRHFASATRLFFLNIFRPALPVLVSIGYFQCHIQSIIFDPVPVFFYKLLKFRFVFVKPTKCFLQNQRPVFKECCIINGRFLCSPVIVPDFLRRQKLFSGKLIQINQIRISGKCRQALIWLSPKLVGPTGSTCQYFCFRSTSRSTKWNAASPRVPIPYSDGRLDTARRIPEPLATSCPSKILHPVF